MFTGIVEDICLVKSLKVRPDEQILEISPYQRTKFKDVELGESIAINGVCLTLTEGSTPEKLIFYVSPETMNKTQLGELKPRSKVNLERALKVSSRLSGHIVQGHVDGVGKIISVKKARDSHAIRFKLPAALAKYCIEKGSICLNGVSLTVNKCSSQMVEIMMIPHTWEKTQFHTARVGDKVNVEVDVLAKYVEKLCSRKR